MDLDHTLRDLQGDLETFVRDDRRNALAAHGGMRIYDPPLMAVAAAGDPWFDRLAEPGIVGPGHLRPRDWLPGCRSVLSYFLPFTAAVRDSNRGRGLPSEIWVSARIDGETFNQAARAFLVKRLADLSAGACAPTLDPALPGGGPGRQLVGTARGVRGRAGDLRSAPGPDHGQGHRREARQRDHEPAPAAHVPALHEVRRVLSVPDGGELRRLHGAMSPSRHIRGRQGPPGLQCIHRPGNPAPLRSPLRVRQMQPGSALRGRNPLRPQGQAGPRPWARFRRGEGLRATQARVAKARGLRVRSRTPIELSRKMGMEVGKSQPPPATQAAAVAQLDRVLASEAKGRAFESRRLHQ